MERLVASTSISILCFSRRTRSWDIRVRYFGDRLIEVIDDLLEAPEVQGTIKLVRPKVLYEFAAPELEDLSAGRNS
jgi:hypothetical protein